MPGPLFFFGAATAMSMFAQRSADRRQCRRLGLDKSYVFETDCVHSDYDSINEMRYQAMEVSYRTMLQHCDLKSWALEHGYEVRSNVGSGITLRGDPYVSYHKSLYQGKPCYYLVWSGIEYIWVLKD